MQRDVSVVKSMINQVTMDKVSQNCEETSCVTVSGFAQNDATDDVQFQDLVTYEESFDVSTVMTNISDPAIWPPIRNNKIIDHIITSGPVQIHIDNNPRIDTGRHFSNCYYSKKLANNETIQRRWLMYFIQLKIIWGSETLQTNYIRRITESSWV